MYVKVFLRIIGDYILAINSPYFVYQKVKEIKAIAIYPEGVNIIVISMRDSF